MNQPIPTTPATVPATPALQSRLPDVGTTIFSVMSALAAEVGAVNLGQGFPDFDCDPRLVDAVTAAIMFGMMNQLPTIEAIRLGAAAASLTVQTNETVVRDLSLEMLYDHLIV